MGRVRYVHANAGSHAFAGPADQGGCDQRGVEAQPRVCNGYFGYGALGDDLVFYSVAHGDPHIWFIRTYA